MREGEISLPQNYAHSGKRERLHSLPARVTMSRHHIVRGGGVQKDKRTKGQGRFDDLYSVWGSLLEYPPRTETFWFSGYFGTSPDIEIVIYLVWFPSHYLISPFPTLLLLWCPQPSTILWSCERRVCSRLPKRSMVHLLFPLFSLARFCHDSSSGRAFLLIFTVVIQ